LEPLLQAEFLLEDTPPFTTSARHPLGGGDELPDPEEHAATDEGTSVGDNVVAGLTPGRGGNAVASKSKEDFIG